MNNGGNRAWGTLPATVLSHIALVGNHAQKMIPHPTLKSAWLDTQVDGVVDQNHIPLMPAQDRPEFGQQRVLALR
jgi:hypothetical protein